MNEVAFRQKDLQHTDCGGRKVLFRGSGIRKIVAGSLYIVEVGGRAVHSAHFAVDIDAVHVDAAVHIQRGLRVRRVDADLLFPKRRAAYPAGQ